VSEKEKKSAGRLVFEIVGAIALITLTVSFLMRGLGN
jgi:hypothetical protein